MNTSLSHVSFADAAKVRLELESSTPAVAGKKRAKDARGIDKFRQVIYGDNGFKRLHAMVQRSTVLMYPPAGVRAARKKMVQLETAVEEELQASKAGDVDVGDVVEKRRRLEESLPVPLGDQGVAHYHHQQLDCFLKLIYEFNHATLMKLPITDTMQLLSRCGREASAHLTEFEMHERLCRLARVEELEKLHKQEISLRERKETLEMERLAFEEQMASEAIDLAAETMRQELEDIDKNTVMPRSVSLESPGHLNVR